MPWRRSKLHAQTGKEGLVIKFALDRPRIARTLREFQGRIEEVLCLDVHRVLSGNLITRAKIQRQPFARILIRARAARGSEAEQVLAHVAEREARLERTFFVETRRIPGESRCGRQQPVDARMNLGPRID